GPGAGYGLAQLSQASRCGETGHHQTEHGQRGGGGERAEDVGDLGGVHSRWSLLGGAWFPRRVVGSGHRPCSRSWRSAALTPYPNTMAGARMIVPTTMLHTTSVPMNSSKPLKKPITKA